jgi:hypothetical protein
MNIVNRVNNVMMVTLVSLLLSCSPLAAQVTTTVDQERYATNGVTQAFVFHFGIWETSELSVSLYNDTTGVVTPLSETAGYVVTLPNDDGWLVPGGTVTTTATYPAGSHLVISRTPPLTQASHYTTLRGIDPAWVQDDFDRMVAISQYLQRQIRGALRLSDAETGADVNLPSRLALAGKYLAFSATGVPIATAGPTGDSNTPTSAFMATQLSNADAAAARTGILAERAFQYNVKDYGADDTGVTDSTTAIQAAYAAAVAAGGGIVCIPKGTYICHITLNQTASTDKTVIIEGAGVASVLKGNGVLPVITVTTAGTWYAPWVIRDLRIQNDGDPNAPYYLGKGISSIYNGASNMVIERCSFYYCTVGVENIGPIMWRVRDCAFTGCGVGVYIESTSAMHGGCVAVRDTCFFQDVLADIAIKSPVGETIVEQVVISGVQFEQSQGYALYVNGFNKAWSLVLENAYFELCATDSTTTFDGLTQKAHAIDANDCLRFIIRDSKLAANTVYAHVNSNIVLDNSYVYGPGTLTHDSTSSIRQHRSYPDLVTSAVDVETTETDVPSGSNVNVPIIDHIDRTATNLLSNGSMGTSFTLSNAHAMTYSFLDANAPGLSGQALKVRLVKAASYTDTGNMVQIFPSAVTLTSGRYVVSSWDIMAAEANDVVLDYTDHSGTSVELSCTATPGKWRRFYGITLGDHTGDRYAGLYLSNIYSAHPETVYLANLQLVEFTTLPAAQQFVREGSYAAYGSGITESVTSITATLDPNSLAPDANDILTVAFAGAALGDEIVVIAPYDLQNIEVHAYVQSAGVCKVILHKAGSGAVNLASGSWRLIRRRY